MLISFKLSMRIRVCSRFCCV